MDKETKEAVEESEILLEILEEKIKQCTDKEFNKLKRIADKRKKKRKETKVKGMPNNYRFTVEDERIYTMFLNTTTSSDVTTKEGFLRRVKRIRFRFNNEDLDGIIKRLVECTEEEFELLKKRCML